MKKISGFTLVEILVAMTLFVALTGIATHSFMRLSSGSNKTIRVLDLHTKSDAILRTLEQDMRSLQQTIAIQYKETADYGQFVFMKPTTDQESHLTHRGETLSTENRFYNTHPRFADFVWVAWRWENGLFYRGQSRKSSNQEDPGVDGRNHRANCTRLVVKSVDARTGFALGMQMNGVPPTPQRQFCYFEGVGDTIHAVLNDGSSAAGPAEKIAVYEKVNNAHYFGTTMCLHFDMSDSVWRTQQDYRHLYTTLELGNDTQLADAYAVRNPDGKSVNKDKLNVFGCEAVDGDGDLIYPSQLQMSYDAMDYFQMQLVKANGQVIGTADDDDTLADAQESIDINGLDPVTGLGAEKRPRHIRLSFLLHDVTLRFVDEEDFDNDGNETELLSQAIKDLVSKSGAITRLEKMNEFRRLAAQLGYSSFLVEHSINLGL